MTQHQHLATQLIERFSQSDVPGVLALMTDDATWHIPGKPERIPSAGVYDKARLERLFGRMTERLASNMLMRIRNLISAGDTLVVEAESSWELKNGRQYRQQYCLVLECRGGKI